MKSDHRNISLINGFTLVELLVVISIIAVLAVIGTVAFSIVQKSGRDAQRQSDLRTIQFAVEQYNADQGYYPSSIVVGSPISFGSKTYLKKVPGDPSTFNPQYSYRRYPDIPDPPSQPTNYCLYAQMEDSSRGVDLSQCALSGYNYEVAPP